MRWRVPSLLPARLLCRPASAPRRTQAHRRRRLVVWWVLTPLWIPVAIPLAGLVIFTILAAVFAAGGILSGLFGQR